MFMESLLIKNASFAVTQNPRRDVLSNQSVLVENGKISKIGEGLKVKADAVIDAKGKALLPGLVNAHTHLPMTLLRGHSDDRELHGWLDGMFALEDNFTHGDVYLGALLGAIESISMGTTCVNDMYFYALDTEKALSSAGLRGVVSWGFASKTKRKDNTFEFITKKLSKHLKSAEKNDRLKWALSPHATYTCTDEHYAAAQEFSRKRNVLLHTHLSETRSEVYDFAKAHAGKRPVEWFNDAKLLGENFIAAHCGWVTKREIDLLARSNTKVVHCPTSNMKLATGGVMPLREMRERGVVVALGTDGPASNNSLDMFREMKAAALIHKHHYWDASVASAQDALDMATLEGARALGWEKEIGSIEVGKKADLVLVDLKKPHLTPIASARQLLSHLVYSATGQDVSHSIVSGKVLMSERKLPAKTVELMEKAQERVKELVGE